MNTRRVLAWPLICALSACTANVDGVGGDDAGDNGAGGNDNARGSGGTTASGGAGGNRNTGAGGAAGATTATGGRTGNGGSGAGGNGNGTSTGGGTGSGGATAAGGRSGAGGAGAGGRTGAGGSGTGGATGAGGGAGSTGNPAICNFASGLNVAWINFANDVPNPNIGAFQTLFQNTFAAGGRVVRWWFHTNGTITPGYDGNGRARPITSATISGVQSILAAAHAAGVSLNVSLWSFDMLQGGENISAGLRTNNQNLLTVDANRQAYIDNVLTPLVTALRGNPGLYSYEIFNEPEGMTTQNGWTGANGGTEVDESFIQRSVNWFADAIHTADPAARVTNAAWTFKACSVGVAGMTNYYSDTALRAAGGRQKGVLDFYEVHYYAMNGAQYSCYTHPASHWGLDKKLVMGEFFARTTDGVATNDLYTTIYSSGYNGAWAWQYNDSSAAVKWPTMQVPMQNVFNAHSADVGGCH